MRIEGDIKVWTDGQKACARLCANGPEGPIVIQASAPLGPIRKQVARMFARKGVNVSGDDVGFQATVNHLGRKKALRRLRRMAPKAFKKGALAPYIAEKELRRRQRHRRRQEQAGRPIGSKALGPIPTGARGKRRFKRAVMIAKRARLKAISRTLRPAAAASSALALASRPGMPPSKARALPPSPRPAGGGSSQLPSPQGGGDGAYEEPAQDSYEGPDAEGEADAYAEADEEATTDESEGMEEADDYGGAGDSDDDAEAGDYEEEPQSDEEPSADDVAGGEYEMGLEQRRQALRGAIARRKLRAAAKLLKAARHNPAARRRVQQIATLAGEGDPKARKTVKTLSLAQRMMNKVRRRPPPQGKAIVKAGNSKPLAAKPVKPTLALRPAPRAKRALAPLPTKPAEGVTKWWDILAPWRRGLG